VNRQISGQSHAARPNVDDGMSCVLPLKIERTTGLNSWLPAHPVLVEVLAKTLSEGLGDNQKTSILSVLSSTRWWARRDSNPQPDGYEPSALTVELRAHTCDVTPDGGTGAAVVLSIDGRPFKSIPCRQLASLHIKQPPHRLMRELSSKHSNAAHLLFDQGVTNFLEEDFGRGQSWWCGISRRRRLLHRVDRFHDHEDAGRDDQEVEHGLNKHAVFP
jgi:hypothetical protein